MKSVEWLVPIVMKRTAFVLGLFLVAGAGQAELKLVVRPDGTKLLYNEGGFHRTAPSPERLRTAPDARIGQLIRHHADRQSLDPRLIQAVIQVESGFRADALSRRGAMGLMQLMPDTAKLLAVRDPWDPGENIRGGTTYLRSMLDRFQRLDLALAAYNAGPTAVDRYGGLPPYGETRNYVRRVLQLYEGTTALPLELAESVRGRPVTVQRDAQNRLRMVTLPR